MLDNPLLLHPGGITTVLSKFVALTFDTLEFDTAVSTCVVLGEGTVVFAELLGVSDVTETDLCVWEFEFGAM